MPTAAAVSRDPDDDLVAAVGDPRPARGRVCERAATSAVTPSLREEELDAMVGARVAETYERNQAIGVCIR